MTPSGPEAPSPRALAALGTIRETLAAARNLEHLTTSRSVGPKVLGQVIPDVGLALSSYENQVQALAEALAPVFPTDAEVLIALRSLAQRETSELIELLARLSDGPLNAKPRLDLEQQLRQTLPQLAMATAHWELLVEAGSSEPLAMSVEELLSSSPKRESDRPHRPVPIEGELEGLFVRVPPRLGMRCLAAWMSSEVKPPPSEGIVVSQAADVVAFTRRSGVASRMILQLPVFFPTAYTRPVIQAALALHGGRLQKQTLGLKKASGPD